MSSKTALLFGIHMHQPVNGNRIDEGVPGVSYV